MENPLLTKHLETLHITTFLSVLYTCENKEYLQAQK